MAPGGAKRAEGADGVFSRCSQPSESLLALATRFPSDFLAALGPQTLSLLLPKLPPQASAIRRRVSRHRVSRHRREPPLQATTAAMCHRTRSHHCKPPQSQCATSRRRCHKPQGAAASSPQATARPFCKVPPHTAAPSLDREPPLKGVATSSRHCKLLSH